MSIKKLQTTRNFKVIFVLLLTVCSFVSKAQNEAEAVVQDSTWAIDSTVYLNRAPVVLDEDTLFYLYDVINNISPHERATLVSLRLRNLVDMDEFHVDSLNIVNSPDHSQIFYRDKFLCNFTLRDALYADMTCPAAAEAAIDSIKGSVGHIRQVRSLKDVALKIVLAILTIMISALVIRYTNRLFKWFATRVHKHRDSYFNGLRIRKYEVFDQKRLVSLLLLLINVLRIVFLIFLFYLTLPILLNIFPWTAGIADMLLGFILDPLRAMFLNIVDYIPNLFTIILIFIVVRFIAKGISYLADEVHAEKLVINGFYPDWAIPTARIINFLLYAFMFVLIWPYLPGSDSAVFKGVSVFLGVLLTFGSSSAISNIVAGVVLTYMRPYQIGHRVRIGEVSGDVVEKNLLVTRLRTIKNEIITVPNSNILSNSSINYSQSSEESEGLIIHTSVTIGYDVPWRLVHKMLIAAAAKTPMIKKEPGPYVLQTALDDFFVKYEINAFTDAPESQAVIYSDLRALIQDEFAKNRVEIMSPHYRAFREGPDTTPPMPGNGNQNDNKKSERSADQPKEPQTGSSEPPKGEPGESGPANDKKEDVQQQEPPKQDQNQEDENSGS